MCDSAIEPICDERPPPGCTGAHCVRSYTLPLMAAHRLSAVAWVATSASVYVVGLRREAKERAGHGRVASKRWQPRASRAERRAACATVGSGDADHCRPVHA